MVENYVRSYYKLAEEESNKAIGLVATIVGRAVSSSIKAGVQTLKNRYRRLFEGFAEELEDAEEILNDLKQAEEEGDDRKLEELRMKVIESVPVKKDLVEKEKEVLEKLISLGEKLIEKGRDKKTELLIEIVDRHIQNGDKVIIFTEFLATLGHLQNTFEDLYGEKNVITIHGGQTHEEKKSKVARLWDDAEILIATDAAGESLNLQAANVVIHYELPWNPVVFIQRVGRVYRYGQKKDIFIHSMLPVFRIEKRVLEVVLQKVETIERDFDIGSVEVISTIISEKDIEKEIWKAYVEDKIEDVGEDVSRKFDKGKSIIQKIRLVLEKAEAAKKHIRAEKLLEDRGIVEIITEENLRRYLFYFREAKLGDGSFYDEFTYFEIKDNRIYPKRILTEIKPKRAEILDLKDVNTLSEKDLKLDNPAIRKALYIGMCQRGRAIFTGVEGGYGEIRLLKLFDYYSNPTYEIPVVIFNRSVKPFGFLQTLEPVILSDHIESNLIANLESRELEIRDSAYIDEIKKEQRMYLKERTNKLLDAISIEEDYYKRFLSDEQAKIKLRELVEMKKKEFRRSLKIGHKLSEPIAKFWVIEPEKLTEMLHQIAENADDDRVLKEIESSIVEFDPELWRKKREIELAGMGIVMRCERMQGRNPIDVSADGRGYDIESYDPKTGEKRRIEVKSFKNIPDEVTLTENEFKAAKFYVDKYYLYLVKNALNADCSEIETVQDPANSLRFEIKWKPYYVWKYGDHA